MVEWSWLAPGLSYYLILFLYLVLVVGSCGILIGWLPAVARILRMQIPRYRQRYHQELAAGGGHWYGRLIRAVPVLSDCWALRWCKPFQVAVSIVEHAIFMGGLATVRSIQLIIDGSAMIGTGDIALSLMLLGLADSKRRINRAGSMKPDQTMRWQWYAFNAGVVGAAAAVGLLATLVELGYMPTT